MLKPRAKLVLLLVILATTVACQHRGGDAPSTQPEPAGEAAATERERALDCLTCHEPHRKPAAAEAVDETEEYDEAKKFEFSWAVTTPSAERSSLGAEVYEEACAECHSDDGSSDSPAYSSLTIMSPRSIMASLETGKMKPYGDDLTPEENRAVSEWLAGRSLTQTPVPESAYCDAEAGGGIGDGEPDWSGWGGSLTGVGYRTAEQAGISAEDVPRLKLRWAFAFPDAIRVRSQPAVVGDLVIVGSQYGDVYALDFDSGCVHWTFATEAAVRGAITVGETPDGRRAAFFADYRTNTYAVDAATGELIWSHLIVGRHADSGVTGSVALYDGRLYVPITSAEIFRASYPLYECCTSSGAVAALDAGTGELLWYERTTREPPREVGKNPKGARIFAPSGATVWASPTIDVRRGRIYVGTSQNYTRPTTDTSDAIMAFDLETGELAWTFQGRKGDAYNNSCVIPDRTNCPVPPGPDLDFPMAPIIVTLADGREILVAGQKSGVVFALDPDRDGELLWKTRIGKGGLGGGIHWGVASDGRLAYATNSDIQPPFLYDLDANPHLPRTPGVYALDLETGEVVWKQAPPTDVCGDRPGCHDAYSSAPTVTGKVVWAGGLDGHLRAFAAEDGTLLWDFDTARELPTVNGVPGHGGAIDGPGPVVARGMVFTQSGYGFIGQMPGNLLLAFAVEDR